VTENIINFEKKEMTSSTYYDDCFSDRRSSNFTL